MYASKAADSEGVGLSGNFAMVVWRSFQAARPSSAFMVSLPILEEMVGPLSREGSICGEDEGLVGVGVDGGVRDGAEGRLERREVMRRKAAMAERMRRKRRLAML